MSTSTPLNSEFRILISGSAPAQLEAKDLISLLANTYGTQSLGPSHFFDLPSGGWGNWFVATGVPPYLLPEIKIKSNALKLDINLIPFSILRKKPKLLVSDVDGTLIEQEVIDELADLVGEKHAVSKITQSAMEGKLRFDDALRARVRCLRGLTEEKMLGVMPRLSFRTGAPELFVFLRSQKVLSVCVSGGFSPIVKILASQLQIDDTRANQLRFVDGICQGEVLDPIVDGEEKKRWVMRKIQSLGLAPEEVVVVGDGANDVLMMQQAGYRVGFCPKPTLERSIQMVFRYSPMDVLSILFGM